MIYTTNKAKINKIIETLGKNLSDSKTKLQSATQQNDLAQKAIESAKFDESEKAFNNLLKKTKK